MKIIDLPENIISGLTYNKLLEAIDILELTKTIDDNPEICLIGESIFNAVSEANKVNGRRAVPLFSETKNLSKAAGHGNKSILFMRGIDLRANQILII